MISFSFQLCLGELQFIVAFCNRSLRFNFLGICSHLSIGLRAGYITGSLSTGNFSLFLYELFLFDADSFDNTVIVALNIHCIPDVLDIKSHDLKSHLSKVGASILDNAHSHLLAVRQNLVNGHVRDNLTQIALQNVINFLIDALLVHAQKVRDGCLLSGHDVRLGVFQTGCLHFFIQNGRVFAVDLNRDNRVNPETYAVLRLNTCFRSLDIDFQKAHIQSVSPLKNGQNKCTLSANHFRLRQAKASYNDSLRGRSFLVAEKSKENNQGCHNRNHIYHIFCFSIRKIVIKL